MRRIRITAAIALVALAFAAVAMAKTNTLKGDLKGDSNGTVTVKIAVKGNGTPKSVTSAKVSKIDYSCHSGEKGELNLKSSGEFELGKGSDGKYTGFFGVQGPNPENASEPIDGTGSMRLEIDKKGEKGSGETTVTQFANADGSFECGTGPVEFKLKAK